MGPTAFTLETFCVQTRDMYEPKGHVKAYPHPFAVVATPLGRV